MNPDIIKTHVIPQIAAAAVIFGAIAYAEHKAKKIDQNIADGQQRIAEGEHLMKTWYKNLPSHLIGK